MPSAKFKHWWIYMNIKPGHGSWQHVGKRFYGFVLNRWPLIAGFVDDTWYEPATSAGLCMLGFIEVGIFIEHKP